jgi:MoaA/NifB/PqqE/SkfB family radical SAM enzyme
MLKEMWHRVGPKLLEHVPDKVFDYMLPRSILVEPTNVCNLKCPLCPTPFAMKREKGFMKYEDFKEIVDELSGFVKQINMNFAGEPLMNEDIGKMVAYTRQNGIKTYISTNGTFLDRHYMDLIGNLDLIDVAIDGATEESYSKYRIGGEFSQVLENARMLCQAKKKMGAVRPYIRLQYIVFKHNEHETEDIVRLGEEIGFDAVVLKTASLGTNVSKETRLKRGSRYLPDKEKYRRYTVDVDKGEVKIKNEKWVCSWVAKSVILWNGDVTTCCYDFNGRHVIGNVFKDGGFKNIWKGLKYRKYRKGIIKKELPLCINCSLPRDYRETVRLNDSNPTLKRT